MHKGLVGSCSRGQSAEPKSVIELPRVAPATDPHVRYARFEHNSALVRKRAIKCGVCIDQKERNMCRIYRCGTDRA
jgi:hypothetical protein